MILVQVELVNLFVDARYGFEQIPSIFKYFTNRLLRKRAKTWSKFFHILYFLSTERSFLNPKLNVKIVRAQIELACILVTKFFQLSLLKPLRLLEHPREVNCSLLLVLVLLNEGVPDEDLSDDLLVETVSNEVGFSE